jgi:hypothetical protein
VRIALPEVPRQFQSWVPETLSFLLWREKGYKRPMRTRIGPQEGRRLGENSAETKIRHISDLFVAAKAATRKDYQRVDQTLPTPTTPAYPSFLRIKTRPLQRQDAGLKPGATKARAYRRR